MLEAQAGEGIVRAMHIILDIQLTLQLLQVQ